MASTSPPTIVVHIPETDTSWPARFTVETGRVATGRTLLHVWNHQVWEQVEPDALGAAVADCALYIHRAHTEGPPPTQDAEGRWVYGEAPKAEVGS